MESRYTWKNQLLITLRNFAVIGAIVLVLGYLIVISGEAARQELEELFVEEKRTITRIDEPVVYGYEEGAKIWELRSQVAEQEKETESSELTRIYELILFKGGEENVLIRGDQGEWDKPREKLTLFGDVEVESADGTTLLTTDRLIWEERTKTLSCPGDVDFWVEDNHIIANSLYSDDDLATIDFVGDVTMFVVGLEGENFVTREGDFPIEDIEGEQRGDGMNVLAEYVHYDKGDRLCLCFSYIPLRVRNMHNLDEQGHPLPEQPEFPWTLTELLENPEYIEALQRSVAQMDLTPEERAFLEGEIDALPGSSGEASLGEMLGSAWLQRGEQQDSETESGPRVPAPSGGTSASIDISDPELFRAPVETPSGGAPESQPAGLDLEAMGMLGPDVTRTEPTVGATPIDVPRIPRSDPSMVLTAPDYERLEGWRISPDLHAELYEDDPAFDPRMEMRPGLVFCYRGNKKFWCEELHIYLGDHRIEGLRQADARFRDLKDEDREPPESRAAQAIQESPTQMISNYLVHNWRENVTEGYGRVLAIQPEKDVEADNVVYYEDADVIHAWGDVIVHQYSGEWWITSGAIEEIEEERAREDVRNPSVMAADAFLSYTRRVSWAYGDLVFRQEEQTVKADRAQYEEDTQILILAGDVNYENENGEQISCALMTLDLYLEEYIAEGAAIARNIVPEEYRENLAEFRGDEEIKPGEDARTRLLENRTSAGLGDWTMAIENPPPPPPIELMPGAEPSDREEEPETEEAEVPQPEANEIGPVVGGVDAEPDESEPSLNGSVYDGDGIFPTQPVEIEETDSGDGEEVEGE